MIYILIILLASFFCFFDIKSKQSVGVFVLLLFLIMWLFVGTRFETGNDWMEYTYRFNQVPKIFEGSYDGLRMEWGYLFLNSLVKTLGGTINQVFLLMAFLTLGLLYKTIPKYTPFFFLAVLLYFRYGYLQSNMMFVRQGLVFSIFLYSIQYIYDRKLLRYMLWIVVAYLFHRSAILLFPMYFILNKKYSSFLLITVALISLVFSQIRWLEQIVNLLPIGNLKGVVISYLSSERWSAPKGFSFSVVERILVLPIILYYREKLIHKFKYGNVFINLFCVGFAFSFFFYQYNVFAERLTILFNIGNIILLSYFVVFFERKSRIAYYAAIIAFVVFWYIRYIYTSDVYLPYQSFLF